MVECCVHGRPCTIGKKLSSKVSVNNEENEESEVPSPAPGYEYVQRSGSTESKSKTISYGLKRKVEREALDVPLCEWNQERPSSSQTDNFSGIIGLPSNCEKIVEKRMEGESFRQDSPIGSPIVPLFNAKGQRTHPRSVDVNRSHSNSDASPPNAYDTVPTRFPCDSSGAVDDDLRTAQLVTEREQAAAIREAYIGPLKKKEAEEYVLKPTSFKIYHRMPNIRSLNNITSDLPLYVVYRSGRGRIQYIFKRSYFILSRYECISTARFVVVTHLIAIRGNASMKLIDWDVAAAWP
uniref:SH2 domain-containing protein n=1 Tax=Parascaris univalens TaxID=6257 RepID=A0A915AVS8_PARUN